MMAAVDKMTALGWEPETSEPVTVAAAAETSEAAAVATGAAQKPGPGPDPGPAPLPAPAPAGAASREAATRSLKVTWVGEGTTEKMVTAAVAEYVGIVGIRSHERKKKFDRFAVYMNTANVEGAMDAMKNLNGTTQLNGGTLKVSFVKEPDGVYVHDKAAAQVQEAVTEAQAVAAKAAARAQAATAAVWRAQVSCHAWFRGFELARAAHQASAQYMNRCHACVNFFTDSITHFFIRKPDLLSMNRLSGGGRNSGGAMAE
jgi:hypothetical protein